MPSELLEWLESYKISINGLTATAVAESMFVEELGLPPGYGEYYDPSGETLTGYLMLNPLPAGPVERTKFDSTAFDRNLIRAAAGAGGPKRATSMFSAAWIYAVTKTEGEKQIQECFTLLKNARETIMASFFLGDITKEEYERIGAHLANHQPTSRFLLACVYLAEMMWKLMQRRIRMFFKNDALGEVFFVTWVEDNNTPLEFSEHMLRSLNVTVPDRDGVPLYPGLEVLYETYRQRKQSPQLDKFDARVLSVEGQQNWPLFTEATDEAVAAARAAVEENASLKESMLALQENGLRHIEEMRQQAAQREQELQAQISGQSQQNDEVLDRAMRAEEEAEAQQQAAIEARQQVYNLQLQQANAQQQIEQAGQAAVAANQQVYGLQLAGQALEESLAAERARAQEAAAKADQIAREKQAADARAAAHKAHLEDQTRKLQALRKQRVSELDEAQKRIQNLENSLIDAERKAKEELAARLGSLEIKKQAELQAKDEEMKKYGSMRAAEVKSAADEFVIKKNASFEVKLQAKEDELKARQASFDLKLGKISSEAEAKAKAEAEARSASFAVKLQAKEAELKKYGSMRAAEVKAAADAFVDNKEKELRQEQFNVSNDFRKMLQERNAEIARLKSEIDSLRASAATLAVKLPSAPVPAPVTVEDPTPVKSKGDRWEQHRLEKPKALEKAKLWWAQHPRAEKADIRQTAKKVVKTAAEYIPGKNDFLGVDTKRGYVHF